MPEEIHEFTIHSVWEGDSDGGGQASGAGGQIAYGLPEGLGGAGGRTNPEELLMSSVAACYSITLAVLAERRRLPITRIETEVEGKVARQPGGTLKFLSIHLKPKITMAGADDAQQTAALDSAHKAEQYCVISNAIRGNVEIGVEPEIVRG